MRPTESPATRLAKLEEMYRHEQLGEDERLDLREAIVRLRHRTRVANPYGRLDDRPKLQRRERMTEQEHKDRVESWLAEAAEEPTPFGKAVIHVCRRRGIETPEYLDHDPDHAEVLRDHCDGVEDAPRPHDLVIAVADAIGLDWRTSPEEHREDLTTLAEGWSYKELRFQGIDELDWR